LTVAANKLHEVLKKLGLPGENTWRTKLASRVSPDLLMLVGSLVGWSAAFILIWIFFTRYLSTAGRAARKHHWPLVLAILFFFLGHAVTFLGTIVDPRMIYQYAAIVLPNSAATSTETPPELIPLRATPVDNAATIAQLPTGSLITLLSRHGFWSYIATTSGQEGWVVSASITTLIPSK